MHDDGCSARPGWPRRTDLAGRVNARRAAARRGRDTSALSWAKLLKCVLGIDVAHRPNRGGELKIIAAILEQPVIEKILTHLGLQADCGRMTAPARGHAF